MGGIIAPKIQTTAAPTTNVQKIIGCATSVAIASDHSHFHPRRSLEGTVQHDEETKMTAPELWVCASETRCRRAFRSDVLQIPRSTLRTGPNPFTSCCSELFLSSPPAAISGT